MIFKIAKAYYINAAASSARRTYMEGLLKGLKLEVCRMEGPALIGANGFQNAMARSNFNTHLETIRLATASIFPSLILEDDIVIRDFAAVEMYYEQVQRGPWDVLYFYGNGSKGLGRLQDVVDTHAYIVNPTSAGKLLKRLTDYKEWIEREKPNDWRTFVDRAMIVFQKDMLFYGTHELIYQDRDRWGSGLGWGWNGHKVIED